MRNIGVCVRCPTPISRNRGVRGHRSRGSVRRGSGEAKHRAQVVLAVRQLGVHLRDGLLDRGRELPDVLLPDLLGALLHPQVCRHPRCADAPPRALWVPSCWPRSVVRQPAPVAPMLRTVAEVLPSSTTTCGTVSGSCAASGIRWGSVDQRAISRRGRAGSTASSSTCPSVAVTARPAGPDCPVGSATTACRGGAREARRCRPPEVGCGTARDSRRAAFPIPPFRPGRPREPLGGRRW